MKSATAVRRRYYLRLAGFMALYVLVLVPVVWSHAHGHWPKSALQYPLAVLPALPTIGVIWAVLRYVVEEEDEFLRLLNIRAAIGATGVTLAVCTAWGFLSNFTGVPGANLMYVFVIYTAALFPIMGWISWRNR